MVNTLLGKPLSKYSINGTMHWILSDLLDHFREDKKKTHRNTQNFKVQKY